jgi:steroid 5-alpha reductase family enzyme
VLVVSAPVWVGAASSSSLSWAVAPGVAVWAVGLFFESVGDRQLTRFKADPANRGKVMEFGLWRYTRHPNYFGDACVWWGLWLVVLPDGGTWWTAIGPVVMTVLLTRVSGKALLEKGMAQTRPGYAEYVARTSGFFPLPPRGRGSSR